jgi:hypothetical protein
VALLDVSRGELIGGAGWRAATLDLSTGMGQWSGHDGIRAFTRHLHSRDYYRLATTLAEAVLSLPT